MNDKLKPCPFCGSSNTTLDYYEISCPQEIGTLVFCSDCGSYSTSVDRWNTRPIENALEARVAELEAENEKLKAAQEWISVEDDLPKEDYAESGATYDLVVQYVNKPAFVVVANYYNKLWCDASTDDWVWIPNEFAKFWRERPLPPC